VLRALGEVGAEVVRTDEMGTIIIRTDGRHLELEANGEKWEPSRGSSR
jgi:beta-lactamase superfamily II metal-dependent hydrolase